MASLQHHKPGEHVPGWHKQETVRAHTRSAVGLVIHVGLVELFYLKIMSKKVFHYSKNQDVSRCIDLDTRFSQYFTPVGVV